MNRSRTLYAAVIDSTTCRMHYAIVLAGRTVEWRCRSGTAMVGCRVQQPNMGVDTDQSVC